MKDDKAIKSLSDADIKTVDLPRRKFLAKVGLRSAAVAAAAFTARCSSSDDCDGDITRIDADPFDPVRVGDRCDTD